MFDIRFDKTKAEMQILFKGDFIRFEAENNIELSKVKFIKINGEEIRKWDSSLLLILFKIEKDAARYKIKIIYEKMPEGLMNMLKSALSVLEHIDYKPVVKTPGFLEEIGGFGLRMWQKIYKVLLFISESFSALWLFMLGKSAARKTDFMLLVEDCGPNSMNIVALISFMVGLILAFVSAIQLKTFGAQIFVADLVTIGMLRIIGAIMVGIIMSGKICASFAASIATMQLNEEIDALKTMGISRAEFLIAPRIVAIITTIPFLTMWADFFGILGGLFVGVVALDISAGEYLNRFYVAWTMKNFWIGVFHGFVYGFIIALCGCYYGVNSLKNSRGVGEATTQAVVSAIVWLIVVTSLITFVFESIRL